jgi:tripartite-type tricarboxylate transporter receptor subunit TctC
MLASKAFPPLRIGRRRVLALGLAAGVPGLSHAAWPDKPLRLVVPFPPGGAADTISRSLAARLSLELGQQVIIENRGGAGGTLAVEMVARAPADGLVMLFGTMGTHVVNPAIYPSLRYDPVKDFTPVALTHLTPRVLVAGPSLKVRSVQELLAHAKANPGRLTYGSAGNGSTGHLSGALFESLGKVEMVHIPYKGSAPLLTDVLAGRIDLTFDSLAVYDEHIKSGRVKALAVTSRTRISALPQVPAMEEAGLAGYDVSNWLGVLVPAGTPPAVVARLNAAIVKSMADPAVRRPLAGMGIEPLSSTPEEFATLIRTELPKWAKVIKASGARIE